MSESPGPAGNERARAPEAAADVRSHEIGGGAGPDLGLLSLAALALDQIRADPFAAHPRHLTPLQRTVGNAAVLTLIGGTAGWPTRRRSPQARSIQRGKPGEGSTPADPGGGNPPLVATMIQVTQGTPSITGNVTAEPSADIKDAVKVRSAQIDWKVDVSLAPGTTLGRGISVGFIQTLESSERVAVYRKGGTPDGEIVGEHRIVTPRSGDALAEKNPATGEINRAAVAPWYSQPTRLADGSPGPSSIHFQDRPSFTVDTTLGEGRLTEIRGADRFTVSIAAMDDGSKVPVYVSNYGWELPWGLTVDPSMRGAGGTIKTAPSSTPAEVVEGPIARFGGQEMYSFPTVAAALAVDPLYLLMSLPLLKQHDPPGWWNAVEALKQKNPTVGVHVHVVSTDAFIGSDRIITWAKGHGEVLKGGLELNDGQDGSITFPLSNVITPDRVTGDEVVTVIVQPDLMELNLFESNRHPAQVNWAFPFGRQDGGTQHAGSGRYGVKVGLE